MPAVGLYELSTHEHILYFFIKIADNAGYDVTVFARDDIADSVQESLDGDPSSVTWVRKAEDESTRSYLSRVEDACDDLDLFVAQSLYPQSIELPHHVRFSPDCKRLVWIYNVNRWLNVRPTLKRGPVWNLHMFLRRIMLRKYDAINVEYPPMADYIETNCEYSGPVYTLTPTLYEEEPAPPTDTVQFTVPGYVESQRRDYELVMDVFEQLFETYGDRVSLHLLGKPMSEYGHRILDRCEALSDAGYDVVYYRDWIPMNEFDETLRASSFLLCPIRPTTTGREVLETYGTTKGSGNVFDALRHATPIILPEYFQIADMIRGSAVHYTDRQDLVEKIAGLLDDPDRLETMRHTARQNAEQFTLESQSERFDAVVAELLDS